ncbi:unnamed protein product [Lupinus luteus]|uniref:Uncharacterized protein n=1 Tax=Lupinus luteus TaxID=3873 RepID=A0AAV1XIF8_LUPLU
MAHKQNKFAGISSNEVDDERRLYECVRKYETVVNQIDELMGMMNNIGKKSRKSRSRSASGARASVSSSQRNNNEALVQTLTRFLHELGANPTDS